MLEEFSRITGVDYPWPRYDQVVVDDFVFGGMENISCTTMTDVLLVDEKGFVEWDPDGLVSHELAHQWFGDLVTCQDWSQSWLNESWATFMEVVWWEHDRTPALATWYRWQLARDYFEEDSGRYRRPIVSYRFRNPIDVFDRHLYQKGGCVLSTLRAVLGEDAFWTGVRAYLDRHAHDTVHSRHFQRALEDATGRNLDRFFAEWIEGAGHPSLKVKLSEEEGLLTVSAKQVQEGKETAEAFAFPLRLGIVTASGERTVDLPIKERERTWAIPVTDDIRTVRVDPGFRVLAQMELDAPRGWLVALLEDECPVLAVRAAKALLVEGSKTAFQAVVKAQAEHPDYHVRQDLARQLGKICAAEVRDLLVARLSEEADPRVRRAVCDALGTYRDATAADALLEVLDKEVETWALTPATSGRGRHSSVTWPWTAGQTWFGAPLSTGWPPPRTPAPWTPCCPTPGSTIPSDCVPPPPMRSASWATRSTRSGTPAASAWWRCWKSPGSGPRSARSRRWARSSTRTPCPRSAARIAPPPTAAVAAWRGRPCRRPSRAAPRRRGWPRCANGSKCSPTRTASCGSGSTSWRAG
jgi:aminopeptidase N